MKIHKHVFFFDQSTSVTRSRAKVELISALYLHSNSHRAPYTFSVELWILSALLPSLHISLCLCEGKCKSKTNIEVRMQCVREERVGEICAKHLVRTLRALFGESFWRFDGGTRELDASGNTVDGVDVDGDDDNVTNQELHTHKHTEWVREREYSSYTHPTLAITKCNKSAFDVLFVFSAKSKKDISIQVWEWMMIKQTRTELRAMLVRIEAIYLSI